MPPPVVAVRNPARHCSRPPALLVLWLLLGGFPLMAQELPFERYALDNGMTVILHQDRTLPLAVVDVWYGVGSKDEAPGRSGFAHLFEHLMFMGTERVPEGRFDEIMEAAGGSNNASTSEDRTNYYSVGPSPLLPTLLWLEADRLESLGRAMTLEKLDLQRDVVRNERRQSYENRPYGKSWLVLPELVYPKGHPYAHPVIGSHQDLEAATVDDVKDFFASFYVPNNASLVVAGDFDPAVVKPLIQDLFGTLPRGPEPTRRAAAPPEVAAPAERTVTDDVPVPRVVRMWISPAHYAEGDAEMDLIGDILGDGASSRLEQVLVRERQLAQDVSAHQDSSELNSLFSITATALPGVALEALEAAIDAEISRFVADGPTAEELERVVNKHEAETVRGLQDLLRRAEQLNMYQSFLGDPGRLAWDLERYRKITTGSLRSWATKVLDPRRRIILRTVPEARAVAGGPGSARDRQPLIGPPARWTPPVPATFPLGGGEGPDVWLVERHQAPLLAMELVIGTGSIAEDSADAGLTALLADLLKEGAADRDARQFAAALDRLGSEIRVSAGRLTSSVTLSCLTRHLDATLDLLADLLLRPRLAEADFLRVRSLRLAELEQRAVDPDQVATVVAQRRLREGQGRPGHPVAGWTGTVAAITLDQVREAHRKLLAYVPYGRLVVVGDVTAADLRAKLEARIGSLRKAPLVVPDFPATTPAAEDLKVFVVDKPGAPQTVIRFLRDADTLGSPRTPALTLANIVFGGSFTSRLNQNLREDHGFTYGATSRFIQGETEGSFFCGTSVKTEDTGAALAEFVREFDRLAQRDITAAELEKALATERTDQVKDFETVTDAASRLALIAAANLGAESLAALYEALGEVNVEAANEAAADAMPPRPGILVLVGDREKVLPQLQDLHLPPPVFVDVEGRPVKF